MGSITSKAILFRLGEHNLKQVTFEITATQDTTEIDSELPLNISSNASESGRYEWESSDEEIATAVTSSSVKTGDDTNTFVLLSILSISITGSIILKREKIFNL